MNPNEELKKESNQLDLKENKDVQKVKDVIAQPETHKPKIKFAAEWTLPSGIKAAMIKGKAKHAMNAGRKIAGDQSMYLAAMVSELIRLDGKTILMETVANEISLPDFNDIISKMSDENFI